MTLYVIIALCYIISVSEAGLSLDPNCAAAGMVVLRPMKGWLDDRSHCWIFEWGGVYLSNHGPVLFSVIENASVGRSFYLR